MEEEIRRKWKKKATMRRKRRRRRRRRRRRGRGKTNERLNLEKLPKTINRKKHRIHIFFQLV